jgi:hypothetical protein
MKKLLLSIGVLIVLLVTFIYVLKEISDSLSVDSEGQNQTQNINEFDTTTLSGEWVSADDIKFTRKFNDDYTYSDSYEDEVTSSGIWFGFDKNNAPDNFPYEMEDGKTYIVINDTSTTLAFMISSVTEDRLEMFYLDGGLLIFNKKQE